MLTLSRTAAQFEPGTGSIRPGAEEIADQCFQFGILGATPSGFEEVEGLSAAGD